jgi:hypothetical protein
MMLMSKLPYTRNEELNKVVTEIMDDWNKLVNKAFKLGFRIRLYPEASPLVLYFHDDYPDSILVDKELSSIKLQKMEDQHS